MITQQINIGGIPAILWGNPSSKLYLHVHGKQSRKEYAQTFAALAETQGYQTLSFDLPEHGERVGTLPRCDIWSGMHDLGIIADYAFAHWDTVSLYACSLGAYFSLHTYANRPFVKCLLQSPVLDMDYLIGQMFLWFSVTEEQLKARQEIPTPVDTLRWDYYQYVKAHPVTYWPIPTAILYGGKDNLQSPAVINAFTDTHRCRLTISQDSEHPFMAKEDLAVVEAWLKDNL